MTWIRCIAYTLLWLPIALLASPARAEPASPIHWLAIDFPPYEIHSGPDSDRGLMDRYMQTVIQRLPQFQHSIDVVGFQRRDALMKTAQPSCTVSRLSTPERTRYAVFAQRPFMFLLPPRLVATRKIGNSLKKELDGDEIPLVEVLNRGQYTLGIYPARRFGEAIDQQLETLRTSRPQIFRDFRETGTASIRDLLHIMVRDRFDLTLVYTVEAEYLRRNNPELPALDYFPITGATKLLPLHVSCNKTDLGLAVIQAVDQFNAQDPAALQAQRDFEALLTPEEKRRYDALLAKTR
ncbi:TIGR02285 family protein [Chitinimonas naiadis]